MALLQNSRTLTLDENGVLAFVGEGAYTFNYRHFIQVMLESGQTTNLTQDQYDSVVALGIGAGAHVTLAAGELQGLEIANLDGTIDITGVDFTEADASAGFASSVDLATLIGSAIDAHDAGHVARNLTVDGSQTEAFKLIWDVLDDSYAAGQNYYDLDLNANFVRLGVEYVNYLEAGGEPLIDTMAKFTADGADADLNPERAQSMHDNLLGNLTTAALEDRFGATPELLAELLILIPDEYEARAFFDGNDGSLGDPDHDGARAFDYDKGWDRPDYIETQVNGTVDARAQAASGDEMLFGDGNSVDNYNIVRHEGAGVELALKAKERGGPDYVGTDEGDATRYVVDAGLDAGTTNRAAWNFDFAATSGISGQDETVDQFQFKLLIDVDTTDGTSFIEIYPAAIADNPTSFHSEQNSWNFGFGFISSLIDGDTATDGVQTYDFGDAEFDIMLEAYDSGVLIATNHIIVQVDDFI